MIRSGSGGGGAGISPRSRPAREPPSLCKQSSGGASLGSNTPSARSLTHPRESRRWTCRHAGGTESGRCAQEARGATRALVDRPRRLRPAATGDLILDPPASAWRVGTHTEGGRRSAEAGGSRSDDYPLKITRGEYREELLTNTPPSDRTEHDRLEIAEDLT